jgi:hypothetical protein
MARSKLHCCHVGGFVAAAAAEREFKSSWAAAFETVNNTGVILKRKINEDN